MVIAIAVSVDRHADALASCDADCSDIMYTIGILLKTRPIPGNIRKLFQTFDRRDEIYYWMFYVFAVACFVTFVLMLTVIIV